jgi:hypothetical protein
MRSDHSPEQRQSPRDPSVGVPVAQRALTIVERGMR